jgi:hypothetical protein
MGATRTLSGASLALVFLAALGAGAQDNPRFAGAWTRTEPRLAPDESHVEWIGLQGAALRIRLEKRGSAGPMGYGFSDDRTYTIDGPPESKRDQEGRVRSVALHWEGASIVFVRTTIEGTNATIEREAWAVSDDGNTLTKERQTTDWRGTRNERFVFRRSAEQQEPR